MSNPAAWPGQISGESRKMRETGAKPPGKFWEQALYFGSGHISRIIPTSFRKLLLLRSPISISCLPCHFDRFVKAFYRSPRNFCVSTLYFCLEHLNSIQYLPSLKWKHWRLCDSLSENIFKNSNSLVWCSLDSSSHVSAFLEKIRPFCTYLYLTLSCLYPTQSCSLCFWKSLEDQYLTKGTNVAIPLGHSTGQRFCSRKSEQVHNKIEASFFTKL